MGAGSWIISYCRKAAARCAIALSVSVADNGLVGILSIGDGLDDVSAVAGELLEERGGKVDIARATIDATARTLPRGLVSKIFDS